MNKDAFWTIIEKTKDIDTEVMYSNLMAEIANLPKDDAQMFISYINGYIELVDQTIWVYMACKVINGYVSDDTGLYFSLLKMGPNILPKLIKRAEMEQFDWKNHI